MSTTHEDAKREAMDEQHHRLVSRAASRCRPDGGCHDKMCPRCNPAEVEEGAMTRAELQESVRLARIAVEVADDAYLTALTELDAHEVTMGLPSILTESVS